MRRRHPLIDTYVERAETRRLREALRFYANQNNYDTMSLMLRKKPEDEHPPIWNDRGAIARAALGVGGGS